MSRLSHAEAKGWLKKHDSSEPLRHALGLDQPGITHFFGALQLAYVSVALWGIASCRFHVVVAVAMIIAATTALGGYFPSPLGHGRVFPNSHVKILCALLFPPQEVVLGIGIGSLVGYYVLLPKSQAWWRAANTASAWGLSAGAAALLAHFVLLGLHSIFVSVPIAALVATIAFRTINEGIWAIARGRFMGYGFLPEWCRGVFGRGGFQVLDLPAVVAGVLVVYRFQAVEIALATTMVAAFLVPLARFELQRQYDRAVSNRMTAALRRNEQRLGTLVQHIPDAISLINAEGTIVFANPSASRVLGYGNSDHVGRSWFEICHPDDVARVKSMFASLVSEPGSHCSLEARMLHKDGSWRWIHATPVNLFMEPSVRAIVLSYRDITQGRRSEETLEEYAARLEDLSRRLVQAQETERCRLAQELHDETGQILTGLRLTLSAALGQVEEGEGRATLCRAIVMVETLQKQLRTLLLNLRPVALDDLGLLPAVLMLCRQYDTQMSLRVKTIHNGINGRRFAPDVEITAYRILQEGLTNVARHARVQEAVVRLWTNEEVLGIQVEDFGRGFDVVSTEVDTGARGLSGMRERVSLVGGEFTIESTPGVGTRLAAELPLRQPATIALETRDSKRR